MPNTDSHNDNKPEAPEWLISNIAEASQNVRNIYFLYIGFLTYCGLTVASTTDRQLILNEPVSLPLLNVDVSLNGFFTLAPLLAIVIFTYMQLYLFRINGLKDDLYNNYAPIERRRLYPWLLNIAEDPEPGSIGKLQRFIANFSLWWPLPIILLLNALWFLRKHDPIMSYVQGFLPVLGTVVVLFFWHNHEHSQTQPGSRVDRMLIYFGRKPGRSPRSIVAFVVLLLLIPFIATLVITSYEKSIEIFSLLTGWFTKPLADLMQLGWGGELIISFLVLVGMLLAVVYFSIFFAVRKNRALVFLGNVIYIYSLLLFFIIVPWANRGGVSVDLSFQALVDAPETDLEGVYWLGLDGAHLENANLTSVVLKRADLRNAHLQGARLNFANLEKANLTRANLQGTHFNNANLEGADFADAILGGGSFSGARLVNANFASAEDSPRAGVIFRNIDFQGATLKGADVLRADFRGTKNLSIEEVRRAKNWFTAFFDEADLQRLGLQPDHNRIFLHNGRNLSGLDLQGVEFTFSLWEFKLRGTNLKKAKLKGIDLSRADLVGANLEGANVEGANLRKANLQGANFVGVVGLNSGALRRANNWVLADYDKEVRIKLDIPPDLYSRHLKKDLSGVNLQGVHLYFVDMEGFSLQFTDLEDAELFHANLKGAQLKEANLRNAHLTGSDLEAASLVDADLEGADFRSAKGLTIGQLSKVRTLYKAKLDLKLMEAMQRDFPHLFQRPKTAK